MKLPTVAPAVALVAALFAGFSLPAAAAYPERPIRIIVPYAAGGSTDISARIIANAIQEQTQSSIVIENRPGGGGNVGTVAVANAAPDGYTVLLNGAGMTILPSMKSDVPYDTSKQFIPVSMGVRGDFSILAHPQSGFKTMRELIAYAKANPKKLNFASSGAWTSAHFMVELLQMKAGIELTVVHYNGNAPAMTAMLSGNPPIGLDAASTAKGMVQAGKLLALAVTGGKRTPVMPDVPTVAESGVSDFAAGFWLGFFMPAKTSTEAVNWFAGAVGRAARDPGVQQKTAAQGLDVIGNTPAEFAKFIESAIAENAVIVRRISASGTAP